MEHTKLIVSDILFRKSETIPVLRFASLKNVVNTPPRASSNSTTDTVLLTEKDGIINKAKDTTVFEEQLVFMETPAEAASLEPNFLLRGDITGSGADEIIMLSAEGSLLVLANRSQESIQYKLPPNALALSSLLCAADLATIPLYDVEYSDFSSNARPVATALFLLTLDGFLDVVICDTLTAPPTIGGVSSSQIAAGEIRFKKLLHTSFALDSTDSINFSMNMQNKRVRLPSNCTCLRTFHITADDALKYQDLSSGDECNTSSYVLIAIGDRDKMYLYSFGLSTSSQSPARSPADAYELKLLYSVSTADPSTVYAGAMGNAIPSSVHSLDFCYGGYQRVGSSDPNATHSKSIFKEQSPQTLNINTPSLTENASIDTCDAVVDETLHVMPSTCPFQDKTTGSVVCTGYITLYIVMGLESGAVMVYRYEQYYKLFKHRLSNVRPSEVAATGVDSQVTPIPLSSLSQRDELKCNKLQFCWQQPIIVSVPVHDEGRPPPPTGAYVGPAYVRALPNYPGMRAQTVGENNIPGSTAITDHTETVMGQFLVAWLDGRLAHCHVGPMGHAEPLPTSVSKQTTNNKTAFNTFKTCEQLSSRWTTVRCLHTPDSLYRIDFFSEYLKPNSNSGNNEPIPNLATAKSDQMNFIKNHHDISNQFSDEDGKRYISCAVSSWSGHTYLIHVLIYQDDNTKLPSEERTPSHNLSTPMDLRSQEVLQMANKQTSTTETIQPTTKLNPKKNKLDSNKAKAEVIFCFDSRLLLAGGACRIFCCATYKGTPSLIFINVDNAIRIAADLHSQLQKFKEPKLSLEYRGCPDIHTGMYD